MTRITRWNVHDFHRFSLTLFLIQIIGLQVFDCKSGEHRLITALIDDYNTDVRPVSDPSTAVIVTVDCALHSIIDLIEKQQILVLKVWMRFSWIDEHLVWKPEDHENITALRIMANRVWRPDITLYQDASSGQIPDYAKHYPVILQNSGRVQWYYPTLQKTTCRLNVRLFPWDEQKCVMKFGSWTYDASQLDVSISTSDGDRSVYTPNGEWSLVEFNRKKNTEYYICCEEPYTDITYTLWMRRKPLYYLFHLLLPCVFITATTILVFYLPPESGEKVSLGVTVLLTLTVFLLIVADTMPTQSDNVPLIAQYFGATIALLALSTSLSVIVMNLYHRGKWVREVPPLVHTVVLRWMATALCMRETVDRNFISVQNRHISSILENSHRDMKAITNAIVQYRPRAIHSLSKTIENGHASSYKHSLTDIYLENIASTTNENHTEYQPRDCSHCNSGTQNYLKDIASAIRNFEKRELDRECEESARSNWPLVALVVDRFLLVMYSCLTLVVTLVILLYRPQADDTNDHEKHYPQPDEN